MKAPVIRNIGGIYELDFEDIYIRAKVSRLAESSRHEITGEVEINNRMPPNPGLLHRARLNMTSTQARNTLANTLKKRLDDNDFPADQLLEFLCFRVLDMHRAGQPPIKLADHPVSDGLRYRIYPFLQEKQNTLIFGEGANGKSWLGILWATLIANGQSMLGMEVEPGNALFLDYETDEDTIHDRVQLITAGLNIPIPEGLYYRRMDELVASDIMAINEMVMDLDIHMIVVDSTAYAVGEPEQSAPTNAYFKALDSLRCTTLTIAHVSKTGNERDPFGSTFWRNKPRANFRIKSDAEPGARSFTLGLKHTKTNNGITFPDKAFRLSFEGPDARNPDLLRLQTAEP